MDENTTPKVVVPQNSSTDKRKLLFKRTLGVCCIAIGLYSLYARVFGTIIYVSVPAYSLVFSSRGICYPTTVGEGSVVYSCYTTDPNPTVVSISAKGVATHTVASGGSERYTSFD